MRFSVLTGALILWGAHAAMAAPTPAEIEAAAFSQPSDAGNPAVVTKLQVLLDRAGVSPGVIDGIKGGMSRSALAAFEAKIGQPVDGELDATVWQVLQAYAQAPILQSYTISAADVSELNTHLPQDYLEKANMTRLGFTSVTEKLGERFHMDEDFLVRLNPGAAFREGEVITVVNPLAPARGRVARILVNKATGRVAGLDAAGQVVVDYPATIGSAETPSPSGQTRVVAVALNPEYSYNPSKNFQQGGNDKPLQIPPGPNGPVGTVWIDLEKPTYGIHGTASPARLFRSASHGCVRLTNWDAEELAHLVEAGATTVDFLDTGVAEVTAAPAQTAAGSRRPPYRAKRLGVGDEALPDQ